MIAVVVVEVVVAEDFFFIIIISIIRESGKKIRRPGYHQRLEIRHRPK